MKYLLNEKEAKQLEKQGYRAAAGQIVDADEMPEWIRKRAERLNEQRNGFVRIDGRDRSREESGECRAWTGAELRSLARALGVDRCPEVREVLGM